MSDRIVLCRKDVAEIGEPKKYCGKPIEQDDKDNHMRFCPDHRQRWPFWPR